MEEVIKQYGTLGAGGILIVGALWLIKHLITVTIPDMNRQAAAERAAEAAQRQASHEKVMEKLNNQDAENRDAHRMTRHGVADIAHAMGLKSLADRMRDHPDGDARPRAGG